MQIKVHRLHACTVVICQISRFKNALVKRSDAPLKQSKELVNVGCGHYYYYYYRPGEYQDSQLKQAGASYDDPFKV